MRVYQFRHVRISVKHELVYGHLGPNVQNAQRVYNCLRSRSRHVRFTIDSLLNNPAILSVFATKFKPKCLCGLLFEFGEPLFVVGKVYRLCVCDGVHFGF